MAILRIEVPDGEYCEGCPQQIRRKDVPHEDYHCSVWGTRANGKKTKYCIENTEKEASNK